AQLIPNAATPTAVRMLQQRQAFAIHLACPLEIALLVQRRSKLMKSDGDMRLNALFAKGRDDLLEIGCGTLHITLPMGRLRHVPKSQRGVMFESQPAPDFQASLQQCDRDGVVARLERMESSAKERQANGEHMARSLRRREPLVQ